MKRRDAAAIERSERERALAVGVVFTAERGLSSTMRRISGASVSERWQAMKAGPIAKGINESTSLRHP
jgi:hypothetical protein